MRSGLSALPRVRAAARRRSAVSAAVAPPVRTRVQPEHAPVFLFSGIGADHPGMGADLFRSALVFRRELERCDAAYRAATGEALIAHASMPFAALASRRSLEYVHASLFSYQYALAAMWMAGGVTPGAIFGYSLGEDAAVCAAGAASVDDVLAIVVRRANRMQLLEGGAMAVLFADAATAAALLPEGVDIAALNGPEATVVSGSAEGIDAFIRVATERKIHVRRVRAACAFHSSAIDAVLPWLVADAESIRFASPRIPLFSSVAAEWLSAGTLADPAYWGRRVRQPIRLWDSVRRLRADGFRVFVEIGPHPMLLPVLRRAAETADAVCVDVARRNADGVSVTAEAADQFSRAGIDVDFGAMLPRPEFGARQPWRSCSRGFDMTSTSVAANRPTFFMVGAARSGTTSVYEYLRAHPSIFMASTVAGKEPSFFCDLPAPWALDYREFDKYLTLFRRARNHTAIGDASTNYLVAPESARRIHEQFPEARIVMILRNPADRAYSLYRYICGWGLEDARTFENALELEERRFGNKAFIERWQLLYYAFLYYRSGLYSEQVARYLDTFPRERVHIVLYDDLKKDALGVVQGLYRFLGVDDGFEPDLDVRNASQFPLSVKTQAFVARRWHGHPLMPRAPIRRRDKVHFPTAMSINMMLGQFRKEVLRPETRRALVERFRPDIEKTAALIGRSLDKWLTDPARKTKSAAVAVQA